MGKKLLIDATHAEETRVVVVDGHKVEEFDFETVHRRQLAGNIYLAKVTRVEPSLQAAFVDYGGNRHGFLAFAEIHPDYYQIPMADRQALLEEERALAQAQQDEENDGNGRAARSGRGGRGKRSRDGGKRGGSAAQGGDTAPEAETEAGKAAPETSVDDGIAATEAGSDAAPAEASAQAAEASAAPEAPDTEAQPEPPAPEAAETTGGAEDGAGGSAEDTPRSPIAAPVEGKDPTATREVGGMEVVDLGEGSVDAGDSVAVAEADTDDKSAGRRKRPARSRSGRGSKRDDAPQAAETAEDGAGAENGERSPGNGIEEEPEPYRAADHAAEIDDQIESVADEDVSDELRPPRRPRSRRYKIQEVIKVRQIMLVQVVKEERGNKGAALTTYLSLAGRYCVLMPNTARGGGISRKITQAADRKKLKEIAGELDVPQGAGLIIRTAGANRTRAEIRRDYEYLSRLWDQIRDLTLQSIAPAPIYAEGDLIKRSIRDLYSREIDEVLVEGETGYRAAKGFMKMIMPSHARNVKLYDEPLPLFARFQVESYLAAMFNPTVQLKSGGYIVIGVTEALVAIDVNSGKATRQGSIEETALQTNLEAAEEIARQLRLRDLAGLIVIDFIDMEERKNNAAVEKKLKDKLKNDRARIQVGRISGFGLLEMSRQRLRPGMLEATTQPCPHCHGTGLIRSDNSLGLTILRALEEEGTRKRSREVLVRAPVGIVNYLINTKREHLAQIELRYGMAIRVEADPALISPDYTLEKFKTATRIVSAPVSPVVSLDAGTMSAVDADDDDLVEDEVLDTETEAAGTGDRPAEPGDDRAQSDGGKPKRRRRRRRRGGQRQDETQDETQDAAEGAEAGDQGSDEGRQGEAVAQAPVAASPSQPEAAVQVPESEPVADAKPARRKRAPRKTAATDAAAPDGQAAEPEADAEDSAKPAPRKRSRRKPAQEKAPEPSPEPVSETAVAEAPAEGANEAVAETSPEAEPATEAAETSAVADAPEAMATATPAAVQAEGDAAEALTEASTTAQPAEQDKQEPTADQHDLAGTELAEASTGTDHADASPADEGAAESARPRRRGWWSLRG